MRQYKLICSDLDKTLLNSKHTVAKETLEILKLLHDQGVYISITTGRAGFDAKKHAEMIGEDTFYMGSNGAILGQKDTIIYETTMSSDEKRDIFRMAEHLKFHPMFVTDDHIYVNHWSHYLFNKLFYKRGQAADYLKFLPNLYDLRQIIMKDTVKIHKVIAFPKWRGASKRLEAEIKSLGTLELAVTPGNVFEITGKGISKGSGVSHLADYLGIDLSEVIAFGDSQNDITMLKCVGLGVAMANAKDEVKAIADAITLSNDDQGVGHMLKKVFHL